MIIRDIQEYEQHISLQTDLSNLKKILEYARFIVLDSLLPFKAFLQPSLTVLNTGVSPQTW